MKTADLVLALIDSTQSSDPCAAEWPPLGAKVLPIFTKVDLPQAKDFRPHCLRPDGSRIGLSLRSKIPNTSLPTSPHQVADEIAINSRPEDALRRTAEALACASASLSNQTAQSLSLPISDLPFSPSSPSLELVHRKMSLTAFFPNSVSANETLLHPRPPPSLFRLSPEVAHHLTITSLRIHSSRACCP